MSETPTQQKSDLPTGESFEPDAGNPFVTMSGAAEASRRATMPDVPSQAAADRPAPTGGITLNERGKAVVRGAGIGAAIALGAVGGAAAVEHIAPHIEDLQSPDHVVRSGDVTVGQGSDLLPAMEETANELLLQAKIDPASVKINFGSLDDLYSRYKSSYPTPIQPNAGGELKLIDLGGTYTFDFVPDIQLPTLPN